MNHWEVVESRYGKLIASRIDVYLGRSLFEYGEFSEGEVELFRQIIKPDHVVCDVGANIGAHTLAFSKMAKHVYAFEPVPKIFYALCGMVTLNDLDNVTCYNSAIGEKEGTLSYPDVHFGVDNNLGSTTLTAFKGERGVAAFPLTTPCHFLKVDVEGMELQVLKGAQDMIREYQPAMYIENDREEKSEELIDFIKTLGYHPYWHCPSLYNRDNFRQNPIDIFKDIGSINMLCAPVPIDNMEPAVKWNFAKYKEGSWSGK